jgi:two-component system, cell cycle sensor histidine kinase and response regulator CckA
MVDAVIGGIFAVAEEGLCLLDARGNVVQANAAWIATTGRERATVIGRNYWELFPGASPALRELHDRARAGEVLDVPAVPHFHEGDEVWLAGRLAPVALPEGVGLVVSVRDVTALVHAPKPGRSFVRDALRIAGVGFIERDFVHGRVTWSDETFRIFGRDLALGVPTLEEGVKYYTPESWPLVQAAIQSAMVSGTEFEVDAEVRHEKETRSVVIRGEMVRDAAGKAIALRGTVRDITERKRATEATRAAHAELSAVIEACQVPLVAMDLEGNTILWSGGAERLFGWTAAEVLGRPPPCVPPDKHAEVDVVRLGLPEGASFDAVVTERCDRDGRRIPIQVSSGVLRGLTGAARGMVAALVDVREQVALRDALQKSEQRFRATFEGSPIAKILYRVADQRVVEANHAFTELVALSRQDVLGRADGLFSRIFSEGDGARFWAGITHGGAIELELPFRASDGRQGYVLASGERISIGGDEHVLVLMQDITVRRRAEQALREGDERFRQLADTIQEVFWLTDPAKGEMVYVSPGYHLIWGRTVESLFASPRQWIEAIHPDDRERVMHAAMTKQVLGTYDEEYRIVRPDGAIRWIHDRAFPVRDSAGNVIRVAGTAEDVSARRSLESQLRQSQKMEAVGRLAGGVAHDFNNLLSVILSYASLAGDALNENDPLRDDIKEIETAGQRAADLTNQLLAFSRQQVLQPTVLDLNESLRGMERLLQRLLGEDIELRTDLDPALWSVLADRGQFEQIIMNLAVNARDAMADGGKLTITTGNVQLDDAHAQLHFGTKPGSHVRISVTDSGCGMDKGTQANVFEPFFTTKEVGKGTGLGLSTVLGIVQQSGGSIELASEVGVGTTFSVYLPRCEDTPESRRAAVASLPVSRRGETILLVEDDPQLRHLAQGLLARNRYEVLVAASPADALALSERYDKPIDLLLTDVVMPGMNGRQLADRLAPARPHMKVLFMSGYTANVVLERGVSEDDPTAFLQKPITPDSLSRAVRRALDGDVV